MEPEHSPEGFSAARRRVHRKKSTNPAILLLGAIVPGAVIGLIVVMVIGSGGGDDPTDDPQTDNSGGTRVIGAGGSSSGGTSAAGGSAVAGQEVAPDVVSRRRRLDEALAAVRSTVERGGGVTPQFTTLLDKAADVRKKVDGAWNERRYKDASRHFEEYDKAIQAVNALIDERVKADRVRQEVRIAAMRADQAGAKIHVKKAWDQAEALRITANSSFDKDQYQQAVSTFEKARPIFQQAEESAKTAKQAQQAKTDFEEQYIRNYPRSRFEAEAGDTWKQVVRLLEDADSDYNNERYNEALAQYQQAIDMIPELELAVRQLRGGKYYAFAAGYTAADALLSRASGEDFTKEQRDILIKSFRNAKLDGVFLRGIPEAEDTPYQDLSEALAIEARSRLDSTIGVPIGASFGAGFQFRIVERLLRGFGPTLTAADKAEIAKSLRALDSEAREAGWKEEIFDFTRELGEKLKGGKEVPDYQSTKDSREYFAEMMTKLSSYDSAIQIMGASNE